MTYLKKSLWKNYFLKKQDWIVKMLTFISQNKVDVYNLKLSFVDIWESSTKLAGTINIFLPVMEKVRQRTQRHNRVRTFLNLHFYFLEVFLKQSYFKIYIAKNLSFEEFHLPAFWNLQCGSTATIKNIGRVSEKYILLQINLLYI